MIKKIAILVVTMLFVFLVLVIDIERIDSSSKDYFIEESFTEVHSKNIVTGIYLDYRLFDSIFEAGILLVSVAGVIFMTREDESMKKE
jgi:multicomponent Na+:H+ antiporter subunit B